MRKEYKQILITALGCLLAAVMICAQLFSYTQVSTKKIAKSEQTEKSDEKDHGSIVMASFSIPSPIHVQMNLDPHLLFEIMFEDEGEKETPAIESPYRAQKFLVTLFRVIIAPNAP